MCPSRALQLNELPYPNPSIDQNFRMGGMPVETAERSMRLFASEVLPALQAMDAPLSPEMTGAR